MPVVNIELIDNASDPLAKVAPNVIEALKKAMDPLQRQLTKDVRARALAHIRFTGEKPGLYLASIYGNVVEKPHRVSGYVRSGNGLAHLLENGFTIKDILIAVKNANDVMAFYVPNAGMVFSEFVHRPSTRVQAYPAFGPAIAARAAEIQRTLTQAATDAAQG